MKKLSNATTGRYKFFIWIGIASVIVAITLIVFVSTRTPSKMKKTTTHTTIIPSTIVADTHSSSIISIAPAITSIAPMTTYSATGDYTTSVSGDYVLISFLSGDGTIVFSRDVNANILVVGGGGGGGGNYQLLDVGGGGGGGGGVSTGVYTLKGGYTYTTTVGSGGVGSVYDPRTNQTNGGTSSISGDGVDVTMIGGGYGADAISSDAGGNASSTGACGGGATPINSTISGGTVGYAGGAGYKTGEGGGGGGGGGMTGIGGNATSNEGGEGGQGVLWEINNTYYGSGGGGGHYFNDGHGGSGAGGRISDSTGVDAEANRGGGGGGQNTANDRGGNGGSGVVIIAFRL